jgi:type IV pilus assembly protein PilW
MSQCSKRATHGFQRGVGLIEVMVSIVIAMLLVLVIYQIYEVSEGQKRTITAGSDATQNAAFGMYSLTRDLSSAGNGIASTTVKGSSALDQCRVLSPEVLSPMPVMITAGATDNDPDTITVLYGGSSSLATSVKFVQSAAGNTYIVQGPVGFSPSDAVVAVQGATCTLSTIDAGGVSVDATTGFSTLTVTPVAGDFAAVYGAVAASLVNLGQAAAMSRVQYTVDGGIDTAGATHALRTQQLLPTAGPVAPLVSDVVNLKAQYGLDTNNDGIIDVWQEATGAWAPDGLKALAPTDRAAKIRQVVAVRLAIVTRSSQYEKDPVTPGPVTMFDDSLGGSVVTMTLSTDDQHYRYKVLEAVVPLRNALWNPQ